MKTTIAALALAIVLAGCNARNYEPRARRMDTHEHHHEHEHRHSRGWPLRGPLLKKRGHHKGSKR